MTSIEGYENYLIFEDGVIINSDTGREMKYKLNDNGYYKIDLYKDGIRKTCKIHRLIGLAFIPNPENKPCIDHINRIRSDNRIENLRWATISENNINKSCCSNTGFQHICKKKSKFMKQGFTYQFTIQRPNLKHCYTNKDLEVILEYRNKFCEDNDVEINDKIL